MIRILPAALWLLACSPIAHAVMPPFYEARAALERIESTDQQRTQAPDVVVLRVKDVHLAVPHALGCPSKWSWMLDAEVVKVLRGNLKPGAMVQVRHVWERYQCPGPVQEPIPSLKVGTESKAFLNCTSDNQCEPAAGPMSLIPSDAFAREWETRKEEVRRQKRP